MNALTKRITHSTPELHKVTFPTPAPTHTTNLRLSYQVELLQLVPSLNLAEKTICFIQIYLPVVSSAVVLLVTGGYLATTLHQGGLAIAVTTE